MYIRTLLSSLAILFPAIGNATTLDVTVKNPDLSGAEAIVIYAEPLDHSVPDLQTRKIEISQKDRAFAPYITVIQRQDTVEFSNRDDFTHHIYSISGENRFSFKLKSGESKALPGLKSSYEAETIAMGCNIHDWMSGFILILDTPYFTKTDEKGQTSLKLKQPGKYRLTLWHPQLKTTGNRLTKKIDVTQDQKITWLLTDRFKAIPPEADEEDFEFLDKY